jgi:serine/threonine protein kinase
MASAVHYLHTEHGIVHRDLHGGNWMVTEDSKQVTMIDFGTALIVGKGNLLPKSFAYHAFQSPELIENKPTSFDSDIWYLGMVFYSFVNHNKFPWLGYSMIGKEGLGFFYSLPSYKSKIKARKPL